jgi:hypothetical protein
MSESRASVIHHLIDIMHLPVLEQAEGRAKGAGKDTTPISYTIAIHSSLSEFSRELERLIRIEAENIAAHLPSGSKGVRACQALDLLGKGIKNLKDPQDPIRLLQLLRKSRRKLAPAPVNSSRIRGFITPTLRARSRASMNSASGFASILKLRPIIFIGSMRLVISRGRPSGPARMNAV